MQRVKVTKKPELHGTGDGSAPCTCKGQFGELVQVFPNGVAIVKLDKGGKIGIPFSCLKELKK